jgi:hypothetical protein
VGLVGIILTVLYAEREPDETSEQEEARDQDVAREDLAGP